MICFSVILIWWMLLNYWNLVNFSFSGWWSKNLRHDFILIFVIYQRFPNRLITIYIWLSILLLLWLGWWPFRTELAMDRLRHLWFPLWKLGLKISSGLLSAKVLTWASKDACIVDFSSFTALLSVIPGLVGVSPWFWEWRLNRHTSSIVLQHFYLKI